MVGVVNPPASEDDGSLYKYKKKAAAFNGRVEDAGNAFGGTVVTPNSAGASTTSTASATSSSALSASGPASTNGALRSVVTLQNLMLGGMSFAISAFM